MTDDSNGAFSIQPSTVPSEYTESVQPKDTTHTSGQKKFTLDSISSAFLTSALIGSMVAVPNLADKGLHLAGSIFRNSIGDQQVIQNSAETACGTVQRLSFSREDYVTRRIADQLCENTWPRVGRVAQRRTSKAQYAFLNDLSKNPYEYDPTKVDDVILDAAENGRWEERSLVIRALVEDMPTRQLIDGKLKNNDSENPAIISQLTSDALRQIRNKSYERFTPGLGSHPIHNALKWLSEVDVLYVAAVHKTVNSNLSALDTADLLNSFTELRQDGNTLKLQEAAGLSYTNVQDLQQNKPGDISDLWAYAVQSR